MAASNNRIKEYCTVHHLMSRIAHRVFFLGDSERDDFVEMVRRAAFFGGLKLLGWCVMTNHFHLLVYLPELVEVSDDEVLDRVGVLKGKAGRVAAEMQIAQWRAQGDEASVRDWFARMRRRMYDIGEFMKTVKQWFTVDYNRRQSHRGTLWEAEYTDRPVQVLVKNMSSVLGYINLNPIRAAASATYDGYVWSSFAAAAKGDRIALDGLRFVYDDDESSNEDLLAKHVAAMDALLEDVKRRRAEEIARRRAEGYEMPVDHLTTEATVAQAAAHLAEVRRASTELRIEMAAGAGWAARRENAEQRILAALSAQPDVSVPTLAAMLSLTPSTLYRHLRKMQKRGVIGRTDRRSAWAVNVAI